ncbi:uncharacterized protein DEA37_0008776 [Paragonimus westermani]|uniref:Uncharacterized protein n=1 Tax=Paragonimus westermani TaxID=34504 RepID=A0A5J4P1E8_9TREM|nr:uncharacterized protein DEA37_0008776 [Paragonimus westermani]
MFIHSAGQAVWTCEDYDVQRSRFYYSPLCYHRAVEREADAAGEINQRQLNNSPLGRLVRVVARILALVHSEPEDVEHCLQCSCNPLHGYSSIHQFQSRQLETHDPSSNCTVARLSQAALNMGLSCANRHYANRSLQIFRILGAHLDRQSLSRLLARLGETVSDMNEELQARTRFSTAICIHLFTSASNSLLYGRPMFTNSRFSKILQDQVARVCHRIRLLGHNFPVSSQIRQAYVTELFYTLEAVISHLQPKSEPSQDHAFKRRASPSQTRTAPTSPRSAGRWPYVDPSQALVAVSDRRRTQRHSTSANVITADPSGASGGLRSHVNVKSPHAVSLCIPNGVSIPMDPVTRHSSVSKTAVSITKRTACRLSAEEQSDLLCGIFWTGIFLLESDFEHEYIAGVRLLTILVPRVLGEDTPYWGTATATTASTTLNLFGRAEAILAQARLNPPFPGLLNLAIKGCSSPNLVDPACQLLVCLIPALSNPLVVPPDKTNLASQLSYPIMILTLLPMLLTAWDEDPSISLNGLCPPSVDATTEQPSVLQGGFLGRGVCTATYAVPRALGSWASTSVALSPVRNSSVAIGSSMRSNRLCRTDSVGFPGNCPTGVFGALSHPGPIAPQSVVHGASIIPKLTTQTPLRPKNPVCIQAANALAQAASQIDSYRLANLELVLKQYASGSFPKDVDQWAKCVVCYMLEGYSRHASHLLQHLTTLLAIGPVCLQPSLLKVAYLFLEQVELNTPDLSDTLQQFITALSNQFLGTDFWTEITKIHQVLVSRSAVLSAPPLPSVHTLSGLDPSGSGRVLDFVAAAAAIAVPLPETEPPHLELAGPQLEFHFDLVHNAPLLAPHLALSELVSVSNQTGPDLNPSPEVVQQKTEAHLPDSGLGDLFVTSVSSWNRSGACQVHLRERLYRLIESYGLPSNHRVGAPRSPSVIFSQSTETLDPQLSVHSSSETASVIDVSNSDDIRLDETSSMEQAEVFRDLDTYLDAQLMNINFLGVPDGRLEDEPRRPWGVRGQSITCHQEIQDDVLEQATDLLPTVRAPLFQATENANDHTRWRSRHRSFPSVACESATAESEPPETNGTIGRGWIDKVSVIGSLGENGQYTLTSSTVLSEGSSTHFASMPQHTNCEPRAPVPLHCDVNDASSSSSSLSPSALDFVPLNATDVATTANDTSPHAYSVALPELESGIPCLVSDFGGTSSGNNMFHVSPCLMGGMEFTRPHPLHYSNTSSRSPSHGSVFVVPSHHSPTSSLHLISTDEHEDRGLRKMSSSASLPQMLLLPLTFGPYESALSAPSQTRPSQIANSTTVQPLVGKSTDGANASGLTGNRNPTHRSLSTSNLLFKGESTENGMKCYGLRGRPLRSPTKRLVTSGVLNRISSPLLKFHKTFTSKRQSCSAEDLLHLVKPKVSFIMPTKEAIYESPQNNLQDQHTEGFDCASHVTVLCGAQQSTLSDKPGVTSPSPDPDRAIPMSRESLSYTWLDLHTLETDWLYDARRAVDRNPVRARITCFTNLSNVFARLANRCYAAVQTTINLADCSWDDANEFRQLGSSVVTFSINTPSVPYVFCQSNMNDSRTHDRQVFVNVPLQTVCYINDSSNLPLLIFFPFCLPAQDMLLDSDQLAIGSPLSSLIELHNRVQAYLYQICQFINAHDAKSFVPILIRALISLLKFLRIACTSSEDVCRYLELSVRPSVAQKELTDKLKCLMGRVLRLIPDHSANHPHPSGSCGKCDWRPVLDNMFTQLLELEAIEPSLRPDVNDRLNRAIGVYRQRVIGFEATMANHRALVDRVTDILEWYLRQRWKSVPDADVRLVHLILPAVDASDGSNDVLSCCSQLCQQLNGLLNQFGS